MATFDRRRFLQLTSAALGTAALGTAGCTRSSSGEGGATGSLRWWDHYMPLKKLQEQTFRGFEKANDGVTVEYTVYNPNEMGQALQLAFKSRKIADVFSMDALGQPAAKLHADGWFSPITLPAAARKKLPDGVLIDGLHVFDDKVHSFPVFSFRQYTSLTWFNKDLVEAAGGDPENGPATWDEFRALARKITRTGKKGTYGWIQGLQFAERMMHHLMDLAKAAGSPGEFDPKTGEYAYGSEPWVEAMEFLHSLVKDKVVFPASTSLDARTARARWVTGVAGMFFDGPWNAGVVNGQFKDFLDKLGVGGIPGPEADPVVHIPPKQGTFWVSAHSKNTELASELLAELLSTEYQSSLAGYMDQPPLDLSVVAKADVHPTYLKATKLFTDGVRLLPDPAGKNPAVAQVIGAMKPARPTLGEIVQGVLSGEIDDAGKALRDYAANRTAERDRAIKAATAKGAEVSTDDWVFSNWTAGEDYTADRYAKA
ncbi:MAG: ABC transporter substrate-binding protein [Micromonosporaceae bacterium]